MNTSIHLEPFLLNEVLADDLPVGERKIRLIVRAFSHVMTMCLRNGQAFALPNVVYGPVDLVEAVVEWDESRNSSEPPLWELDGFDVASLIAPPPRDEYQWLITLSDIWVLIEARSRDADPSISDEEIVAVLESICEAVADVDLPFDLPPVTAEVVIEDWVMTHLGEVADAVEMPSLSHANLPRRGRQYRFSDRTRADLICWLDEAEGDLPAGTWVVVELKAGFAVEADVDQLAGYLRRAREELSDDEPVIGVLIADGFDQKLVEYIEHLDSPVVLQTLTACGYHEYLYAELLAAEAMTLAS